MLIVPEADTLTIEVRRSTAGRRSAAHWPESSYSPICLQSANHAGAQRRRRSCLCRCQRRHKDGHTFLYSSGSSPGERACSTCLAQVDSRHAGGGFHSDQLPARSFPFSSGLYGIKSDAHSARRNRQDELVSLERDVGHMGSIRIAVFEQMPLFRAGIIQSLNAEAGMEVVAEGNSIPEAVAMSAAADVVIVDANLLEGSSGPAGSLVALCSTAKVILLTFSAEGERTGPTLSLQGCGVAF